MNVQEKLAFFLPELTLGGAEKSTVKLANIIVAQGDVSVDLVVASKIGPELLEILSPKVRLIKFNKKRILFSLFSLIFYLRKEKPKALLSVMEHANVIALVANTFAGKKTKIVATIRSHLSGNFADSYGFRTKVITFFAKYLYGSAGAIVAVAKNVARDAEGVYKLPQGTIKTIYNPILSNQLYALADVSVNDFPLIEKDRKNTKLIVSVGRLENVKNHSVLIRATKKLLQTENIRLLILGDGGLRSELEKLIRDLELQNTVFLPGTAPNPYVYMKNCDLFVLPSKFEGLSGALIEALALSPRVIATDCPGGNREILDNGRYGRLVKVDDVDALAHAMTEALSSQKTEVDASFLEQFVPDTIARQYIELFNCI